MSSSDARHRLLDALTFHPGPERFAELAAAHRVVPVELKILGDGVTPMTLYQAVREKSRYSILLESVQGDEVSSRYSFIAFDPREVYGAYEGQGFVSASDGRSDVAEVTPAEYLARLGTGVDVARVEGLPPFTGGAVGYVGFDAVSQFGDVTLRDKPRLPIPEIYFLTFDRILAFDHRAQTLSLIQNAWIEPGVDPEALYRTVQEQLLDLYDSVSRVQPLEILPVPSHSSELPPDLTCNFSQEEFADAVRKVKEYIKAGDIFQGVLSRRFSLPAQGMDPFDLYRVLRFLNPSPYMFLLEFGSFQVVGASPEALVRSDGQSVEVRPIAGTRKRGRTEDEDRALAEELLADPKERAEHVMLVDLGRNDVGRVAEYGTVNVSEFMEIERFSHVMHIVSRVVGQVRPDQSPMDVFEAAFPAGTVSGAPKIRAIEIIDELEPESRGLYSGGIGYFGFDGHLDSCIAIRTVLIHEQTAYIQAGAGIVADSDPIAEAEETLNKAQSLIQAIRFLRTERAGPGRR